MNCLLKFSISCLTLILCSSCVSIIKNRADEPIDIKTNPLMVQSIDVIIEGKPDNGEHIKNNLINGQNVKIAPNKRMIKLVYLPCTPKDQNIFLRLTNAILPILTIGFYPHRMAYNCPFELQVVENSKPNSLSFHDIEIKTRASIYDLFSKLEPIDDQINTSRYQGTIPILRERLK